MSMNETLLNKCTYLHNLLAKDERILSLDKKSKILDNDEEVIRLAIIKDNAQDKYNDMVRFFKEGSAEVNNAQHELYLAKLNLDNNELVQDYLKSYKEVKLIYARIDEEIFKPFNKHICKKDNL